MLSAIDTIKKWFQPRPKDKSFIVHRVSKVIHKQDTAFADEDQSQALSTEKHKFILELTIDEEFSLDGIFATPASPTNGSHQLDYQSEVPRLNLAFEYSTSLESMLTELGMTSTLELTY